MKNVSVCFGSKITSALIVLMFYVSSKCSDCGKNKDAGYATHVFHVREKLRL